ncbi:MAG: hypothetical protein RL481_1761 [Pseudomonadota bacterium]|jgi:hypothetical protein
MARTERKYKGSLTIGKLEIALEGEKQAFGTLENLEAVGGMTIATFDDAQYPTLDSLSLLPTSPGMPAPAPSAATHMFDGKATVLGAAINVSVFRVS